MKLVKIGLKVIKETKKINMAESGFTLVELLVASSIMVFVILGVSLMLEGGYNTYAKVDNQVVAQSEARRNLFRMAKYIRQCKQITQADTYELTITSDIDDDDVPETVHFYLTDANAKLIQTVDGTDTTELGKYVANVPASTAIFTYYDAAGSQITDMSYARTASRSMKIKLMIDASATESPDAYELESIVSLRNFD